MKHLKQTIIAFAVVLISTSSFAQDAFSAKVKGSFLASGSFSINATTSKRTFGESSSKTNIFGIIASPKAGYYIMDNLAVGLALEIGASSEKADDSKVTSTSLGVGPFARYHLDNGIFGEAGAIIGSTKQTQESGGFAADELKSNVFGFRAGGGYSFFIGNHIAIEPAVYYVWQNSKPKDAIADVKTTLSTIFFNLGFTAYF